MQLSDDVHFDLATWQPYQPNLEWLLPDVGEQVEKMALYVQARDANDQFLCKGVKIT